jgi:glycosyltransferase involved in cell wall biosynthesis
MSAGRRRPVPAASWTATLMTRMPERVRRRGQSPAASRPRLGVLATHAIQYQAPLYQELSRRAVVELEVAFLNDRGARSHHDPGFGVTVAWDIDLLGGYRWTLLEHESGCAKAGWLFALSSWLRRQDIVVLHGHADPEMLLAAAACRTLRVPYLLRGEAHPDTAAKGWRRPARHALAALTVRGAAGALPIGQLNAAFYDRYGRIPHFRAPYSVDNDRFRALSDAARSVRTERLTSLGLDPRRPTAIFSGKLTRRKRPLDAVRAIERCNGELSLLVLGDGPLRDEVRRLEARLPVRCLGFVNQSDLPGWYASGDVLVLPSEREPWGLVVNEGMACGLVPVVSEAVGCAQDLVDGIGEIVPVGNIDQLARALLRASREVQARRKAIRGRLERYTITETAQGYEQAALALHR